MCFIIKLLDNTFFGTLLAGILLGYFGFWLYGRQKKIDIDFEDVRKLRDNASSLFATLESASKTIGGLFNMYDGKNLEIKAIFKNLTEALEAAVLEKMGGDLSKISKEIVELSEGLTTKLKIKNICNADSTIINDKVAILSVYLQTASISLKKLSVSEVEEWRKGWDEGKQKIQTELNKILG